MFYGEIRKQYLLVIPKYSEKLTTVFAIISQSAVKHYPIVHYCKLLYIWIKETSAIAQFVTAYFIGWLSSAVCLRRS